jgi:DNA polymerase-4
MDTIFSEAAGFNPTVPVLMHIDLNSCFATVEQQANPKLRGKPVAVAAYTTGGGCILAASYEAKKFGVTTGIRVRDGRALCPDLIILPPDPDKYRFVNRKLLFLLREYTADVTVKSIDEMALNLASAPKIANLPPGQNRMTQRMQTIGEEIKRRIKAEIGDYLTVSIGISTNRFLAKIASGLHKPDGLDFITADNVETVFSGMELEEICGIKSGYGGQLRQAGITTALSFYRAPISLLRHAFHSIIGYHWWLRLHGWEADDRDFGRKSFGNSHALYVPYDTADPRFFQILCQLSEKTGRRLRAHGYAARGVAVSAFFSDRTYAHKSQLLNRTIYASGEIYEATFSIIRGFPAKGVRILAIACFALEEAMREQLELFVSRERVRRLTKAIDQINDRWGEFVVRPGRMLGMERKILDRIAFGGIKELEEFTFREEISMESFASF